MTKTISRLFDTFTELRAAVGELEAMGYSHAQISVVASNADGAHSHTTPTVKAESEDEAGDDAGKGAVIGGVIGGAGGLLAALGLVAIPALGPVVAAGWLISTVVGAVVGAATAGAATGLVSALTRAGIDESDAKVYAEGIKRGGALVSVRVDDADYGRVGQALDRFNPVDVDARGKAYRASGWS